jgi:hypothetical protein
MLENRTLEKKMKSSRSFLVLSLSSMALLLAATAAKADPFPLSLDLTQPTQSGGGGDTLTFAVDVTNDSTTDTVYLNDAYGTLSVGPVLDTTDFFNNAPFSLDPLESSGVFDLFTVFIPDGTSLGAYDGIFEILGGGPADSTDVAGFADFEVDVTPEPSSFLLLATGLLALTAIARRKLLAGKQA